ncbi:hypothetical protein JCM10908_007340 [Rhodotorula pacifica]|uniref:uncharacterized protein n=1 Tax=Rhodotorula pacifica TaxID=1495444 RepID=UPI00318095BD
MGELTDEQHEAAVMILSLGITEDTDIARRAAIKFPHNMDAAVNWIMDGAKDDGPAGTPNDDLPPPLIPAGGYNSPVLTTDEVLPHPSTLGRGTTPVEKPLPPPPPYSTEAIDFRPTVQEKQPVAGDVKRTLTEIDLTADDSDSQSSAGGGMPRIPAPSSTQKLLCAPRVSPTSAASQTLIGPQQANPDDLQLALLASRQEADDNDDELTKAISMSMATLGSTEDETIGMIEAIKPEERIREGNSPVILRATSNLMSGLSSYFQCLYALPSFRNAVLAYSAPPRAQVDFADYRDYWKGDSSAAAISSLGLPIPVGGEKEARETRLIALQRLFALMHETRRSFLHITEVVRAFGIRESDFQQIGGAWVYKITEIHTTLIEDLRIAAGEAAQSLLAQGRPTEEVAEFEKKAANRFVLRGRIIPVDQHIGAPLPPNSDEEDASFLKLEVNPLADPPQTLFDCLDHALLQSSNDTPPRLQLHLLTAVPSMVMFHLERDTIVTSLDKFGTGASSNPNLASRRHPFRPSRKGDEPTEEELLWLDRYWVKNRVKIAKGRTEMTALQIALGEAKKKRREIAMTPDGKDARQLVRGTVEYLEKATGGGDSTREERQKRLREQWSKVADELDLVVQEYDAEIATLDDRRHAIFSGPDMQKIGPYRLSAILMRNGLNGRGTAWPVVRDHDGKWWRMLETSKVETTLEEVLSDPSGLKMDAGSTFLFYEKVEVDEQSSAGVEIPPHLKRAALIDNHEFAASLPESFSATVDSWNLPPVEALEPAAIQIPLAAVGMDDDSETVKDISLDGEEGNSPPPEDIMIDEKAAAAQVSASSEGAATPMSLDESDSEVPAVSKAMQLRGGATVEDVAEDEDDAEEVEEGEDGAESDYDDEDEIDEDEVELGLLRPMPAKREEWDIDYAIGKVGGLPRWLDPRSPLAPEDVQCGTCGKTMSLLLQVNSPDDERPHAAARSLYVFACRTVGCLAKEAQQAVRVWRTQMESPNAFYPHTEATQAERKRLEDALDPTSALSGPPSTSAKPWPEYDIAAEPEPYEESYLPETAPPAPEQAEAGSEDAEAPDTRTGVDSAFLIFQERIEREPKQVLRFYRIPGVDDPQPLWASNRKIGPEQVPTCELCRAERKIEFQILSTLLPSLEDDAFEFDSLLVYTCANNCELPARTGGKTGWQTEVAFKQDFAAAGVKFGGQ